MPRRTVGVLVRRLVFRLKVVTLPSTRMTMWTLVAVLGLSVGVGASASDAWGSGLNPSTVARVANVALNAGSVWAVAAIASGWIVGSPRRAFLAGPLTLSLALFGYYAFGATVGDRTEIASDTLRSVAGVWLVAAVVAGPVLGLLGAWAHRRDAVGTLAALAVPLGVLIEVFGRFHLDRRAFAADPLWAWTLVVLAVTSVVLAATAIALRDRR